jgi:drug/metabolite transporter (DMT)-like permease
MSAPRSFTLPPVPVALESTPAPTAATSASIATLLPLGVLIALAAVYVIWGSTYFVVHLALRSFPPLVLAGTRLTLAGLLLYALARRVAGVPAPTRAEWRGAAQLGVLLLVVGHGAVVFAQQWVPSSLAALSSASIPLWAAAFAALVGSRPTRREGVALALGFAGVAVLNAGSIAHASLPGMLLLLVAAASWALGSVRRTRVPTPRGLAAPAAQMLVAGPTLLLLALVRGERLHGMPSAGALAALTYLIVFGSVIAFSAYNYLLERVRPTLASSNAWVNPIFAVALGAGLGGEAIGPAVWLAGALVLGAVVLLSLKPELLRKPTPIGRR